MILFILFCQLIIIILVVISIWLNSQGHHILRDDGESIIEIVSEMNKFAEKVYKREL